MQYKYMGKSPIMLIGHGLVTTREVIEAEYINNPLFEIQRKPEPVIAVTTEKKKTSRKRYNKS